MRDRYSSFWIALLGIAVGVLATTLVARLDANRRELRAKYTDWRKLNLILSSVDENYVDTVDRKAVTDAAISAVLGALDPHSVYMPPVQLEESEAELQGNFDGIGIQFNVPNDTAVVLEVIPGGPSEKIGLQPGDRLLKVDGVDIAGVKFPQDSMVRRMRGPAGTKVTVTVARGGDKIPFEITRGKIPLHSVDAAFMVDDTTAYLRLSKFARTTAVEVATRLAALPDMKRLIFDLRDNTGGYFDQALMLSDFFLPKGASVVYIEGLHRPRKEYKADGKGMFQDVKLVLLVDEGSASSSEILAGAIQDNDRGSIVGRRTFGKGLVQEPLYFTDGSGVRLTVARYYTPSGRCIQKPYASEDDYAYGRRLRLRPLSALCRRGDALGRQHKGGHFGGVPYRRRTDGLWRRRYRARRVRAHRHHQCLRVLPGLQPQGYRDALRLRLVRLAQGRTAGDIGL